MVAEVQKQTRILGGERGRMGSGGGERERGGIIHNGRSVGANSSLPLGFTDCPFGRFYGTLCPRNIF